MSLFLAYGWIGFSEAGDISSFLPTKGTAPTGCSFSYLNGSLQTRGDVEGVCISSKNLLSETPVLEGCGKWERAPRYFPGKRTEVRLLLVQIYADALFLYSGSERFFGLTADISDVCSTVEVAVGAVV